MPAAAWTLASVLRQQGVSVAGSPCLALCAHSLRGVCVSLSVCVSLVQMHRRMKGDAEWESVTRKVTGE